MDGRRTFPGIWQYVSSMLLDLKKTAFDVDGVVLDVVTPFLRLLKERHGYDFTPEDVTGFELDRVLGVPRSVVVETVHELLVNPIKVEAKPYPGAGEMLRRLSSREPLLFVTAREDGDPVRDWFKACLPELDSDRYEIVAVGEHTRKADYLMERERLYYFDDYLETCLLLDQAGLKPFVFDQPWNRRQGGIPRVRGWNELGGLFGCNCDPEGAMDSSS